MYYLGVDLGGTNIKAALVDADGAIIKEASTPTKLPRPAEAVCDDIAALCNQLAQGQLVARHWCWLPRHGGWRPRALLQQSGLA